MTFPRVAVDPASSKKDKKELSPYCFLCNRVGHYRWDCPLNNHDVPVEARGWQPTSLKYDRANTRFTAALQGDLEDGTTSGADKAQEWVEQLQQKLRQAELNMSLAKATATTNLLSKSNDPDEHARLRVGPILMTQIQVEVLDTGSPVSLILIDFLL